MAEIESRIRAFQYSSTLITLAVILLFYQVMWVHRSAIKKLQTDPFDNPYAARLQTYTDNGLTNSSVISWGRVGGTVCPNKAEALAYLENDEGFLGSSEPPVFYDIGDLNSYEQTRNKSGYDISKHGVIKAAGSSEFSRTDQFGPLYYKVKDADGTERWVSRDVYCRGAAGLANSSCVPWLGRGGPVTDLEGSGFAYVPVVGADGKVVRYERCPTVGHKVKDGACYLESFQPSPFGGDGFKKLHEGMIDDDELLRQGR